MSCHRVRNHISAYLDRELTGNEMLEVREHIRWCDDCRAEYHNLQQVKSLVRSIPELTPDQDVMTRLRSRIEAERRSPQRLFRGPMSVVVSTVAAAVAALVIFSYLTSDSMGDDRFAGAPDPSDADRLVINSDPTGVSPILPVGLNK